ncbi:unnamed protein product [Rhodiola kirilowii]
MDTRSSEIESVEQSSSDRERSEQPRELPEELAKNVIVLTCESSAEGGSCVVHVIGTSHFSKESCRRVKEVISYLKPEVVFLEVCSKREFMLENQQNLKVPTVKEMLYRMMKKNNPLGVVYSASLIKIANHLGVVPGAEFQVAFNEAKKYGGKIVLGDRPVEITMRRLWEPMPLWQKMTLLGTLYISTLFLPSADKLNAMIIEKDISDVIPKKTKCFPNIMERTLVHERDQYMSSRLLTYASESSSVVAVVGKAHLGGIKKYWKQSIDLEKLMEIPSHKARITIKRIISILAAGIAVVAIVRRHSLLKKIVFARH